MSHRHQVYILLYKYDTVRREFGNAKSIVACWATNIENAIKKLKLVLIEKRKNYAFVELPEIAPPWFINEDDDRVESWKKWRDKFRILYIESVPPVVIGREVKK